MFGVNDNQNGQAAPSLALGSQAPAGPGDNPYMANLANPISGHPADEPASPSTPPAPADTGGDNLLDIKKQALQNLTPLVGQLDQPPEERFKTLMMLIQASDNPNLLKQAYEAAQNIPDQKARAQALIDVVNEINYFTQQQKAV